MEGTFAVLDVWRSLAWARLEPHPISGGASSFAPAGKAGPVATAWSDQGTDPLRARRLQRTRDLCSRHLPVWESDSLWHSIPSARVETALD